MMVASSTSERVMDDSADDDSNRNRESGIVGVAGGSRTAGIHVGAGLVGEGRVESRLIGTAPLDTDSVNTMTGNSTTAIAMSAIAISSNEVSVSRESVDRNSIYRGTVDQQPVDRELGEREASPVASAEQSGTSHDDIDIATDDVLGPTAEVAGSNGDDETIEVADDEIETADPALSGSMRPAYTLPSPASSIAPPASAPYTSFGVTRSRPPAPPSSRPRMPMPSLSGLSLPRPLLPNGASASNRPSGIDPWALANKTLELAHANARIGELEELVAYRDARIAELEENLARTRRKLEDIEQRSRPVTLPAGLPAPVAAEPGVRDVGVHVERDVRHDVDDDGEDCSDERDSGFGPGEATIARGGSEDDLQQISGIGPRFEAALRKQGITRLSQIAAWSEEDVRQMAKALKIPKSRIVKGRWVEVAREVIGTRAASE
jgi:hypothetical protein